MDHAEKMYLVSHHQMEQLQGRPPTIGATATNWLDDEMQEPRPLPTLPEQPPQPSPQDTVMDEILRGVSTHYRKNVELLLNKMKQHQDVSTWDDRGTFLYKGVPIPGTNILDLVKGASQH
ncbi:hypothetical protein E2320_022647 [Naja naja]|nr:hypothetical protein E2320_022647 [Naja naja]